MVEVRSSRSALGRWFMEGSRNYVLIQPQSPSPHASSVCSRSNSMLGLVMRGLAMNSCPQSTLHSLGSLLAGVIRTPFQIEHIIAMIDSIQTRSIRFILVSSWAWRKNYNVPNTYLQWLYRGTHSSPSQALAPKLTSPLRNILVSEVDSTDFLGEINLRCMQISRSYYLFINRHNLTQYAYNSKQYKIDSLIVVDVAL